MQAEAGQALQKEIKLRRDIEGELIQCAEKMNYQQKAIESLEKDLISKSAEYEQLYKGYM